jgi:hypothetical protein
VGAYLVTWTLFRRRLERIGEPRPKFPGVMVGAYLIARALSRRGLEAGLGLGFQVWSDGAIQAWIRGGRRAGAEVSRRGSGGYVPSNTGAI